MIHSTFLPCSYKSMTSWLVKRGISGQTSLRMMPQLSQAHMLDVNDATMIVLAGTRRSSKVEREPEGLSCAQTFPY